MPTQTRQNIRSLPFELRVARSAAEIEAIGRLRYDVYVEELGRNRAHANHAAHTLHEAIDEESVLIGAFTEDGAAIGTIRLTPSTAHGLNSRDIYGWEAREVSHPTGVCLASKLIVAAAHRGTHLGIDVIRCATNEALRRGWRYCFLETYDNLVALYQRLGFAIRNQSEHPVYGNVTIMEWDLLDIEHMRAVRSPMLKGALAHLAGSARAA